MQTGCNPCNVNNSSEYQKFVYWLDPSHFLDLNTELLQKAIRCREIKKAVCVPLSKRVETGYILPETWGNFELCKRQLSWYRSSKYFGKVLLVSSQDFKCFGLHFNAVIRQSSFKPPYLPSHNEKLSLIERRSFKELEPIDWSRFDYNDIQEQERRLKLMGLRGVNFQEVFVSHSANHANFIEPVYFVDAGEDRVPYSICKTSHVCSACMEWYSIIGDSFRTKLVVPCPGAVLFAGLITNRYYEVLQNLHSENSPITGDEAIKT
jgi:hypothetical protein